MSTRTDVSMNAELAEPSVNTPDIAQLADEAKNSTLRRCALTIAAGLVLTAITVGSLAKWITAQWSHFPGPYSFPPPNQNVFWVGYTVDQFVGLTFFVLCCTTGYCLLWIGITTGARVALAGSSTVVAAIFLGLQGALALASIAVGLIGAIQWGGESFMNCLGVFCINTNKYHEITLPHTVRDSAGEGWLGIIGMAAFLSLFPLGCLLLFRIVRMAMDSPFPNADVQPHDIEAARVVGRRNRVKLIASVILSEIFLLFLAFVSFYFPDDWEYFTDARIAQSAALQVVDPSWSAEQYNNAISTSALVAAEFPWAFFKTHQVQLIANQFYLKLWPGNVMFYCYLVGILASSFIVTHTNRRWAEFWSKPMRKIHLPKSLEKYFGMRMTRGEFVGMWITKWLTMVFAVYWFHDHNYNNNWSLAVGPGTTNAERWARSFGQLAVLFLSLLMFAASRNSLFHKLLGTSWESFLWAHKALGWAMLIATFLHMVLWWKQYSNLGVFPQEIFHVPPATQETADNFTVPLIFITTMILFIAMGALTYEPIRRRAFEVFYFAHLFAAYTTIPLVLWHAASGFEYMLPGLTVWFLDRLYRASCSAARVNLLSAKSTSSHDGGDNGRQVQPAESVEFKFTVDAGVLANAQPGQYVFVNVAEISIFEWHPFTLSRVMVDDDTCLNNGRYLSLHIKAMDPGSWTYRLFQLVSKLQDGDGFVPPGAITLAVDGPVGTPFHAEQYTDVVLIGGGIGITPVSAIFDYFKRARVPNFVTPAEGDAPLLSGERRLHALWALREEPLLRTDLRHCLAPWTHDVETRGVEGLSSVPMFATQSSTVFLTRFCDEKSLSAVMNSKELSPHARSITMACGRPNVDRLLRSHLCVAESAEPEIKPLTKPIVFVCGPEPLVQSVMQWCDTFGVPVHRETFLL